MGKWTRRQNVVSGLTLIIVVIGLALTLTHTKSFLTGWVFAGAIGGAVTIVILAVMKARARRND